MDGATGGSYVLRGRLCVWGVQNMQYLRKTVAYFMSALIAASYKEKVQAFVDLKRPPAYNYPGCCAKE
jgi:hypothetical protein